MSKCPVDHDATPPATPAPADPNASLAPDMSKCPVDHSKLDKSTHPYFQHHADASAPHPHALHPDVATADPSKCPVDHSKLDKSSHPYFAHASTAATSSSTDTGSTPSSSEKCPVDHTKIDKSSHPFFRRPAPVAQEASAHSSDSLVDDVLDPTTHLPRSLSQAPHPDQHRELPVEREVSTIPRGGQDANEGEKWIYPSQQMFFNAMKRKSWDAKEEDMSVVVPIHNAVNEMAWKKILEWEALEKTACDQPKLTRFQGRPGDLTPRAWFKSVFMGYTKPFDRHDWTVDRCGTNINYVIDFYTGKLPSGSRQAGMVSFYLDVRPKLDSWEGIKLRTKRFWTDLMK
ncbi:Cytochrome c1 heme lyase [Allomyces arbusculus]|nr:Cytochrome c1 heme lyase [Allomyces arbusculus]